jgi:hypothetical protein
MTDTSLASLAFKKRALADERILGGLIRKRKPENALALLINALADAHDVREVGPALIQTINLEYKIDLHAKFGAEFDDIYAKFISLCLSDRKFSDDEVALLLHLKDLFAISDDRHNQIYEKVGSSVYSRAVSKVAEDAHISEEERKFLKSLAIDLELPEKVSNTVYWTEAKKILEGKANEFLADGLLEPEEEHELAALARALGDDNTLDGALRYRLNRCRMMWMVKHGTLPTISPDISLSHREECYMQRSVDWYEMRRLRLGVAYAGPSLRLRIAKGVYWNMGTFARAPITTDQLQKIDSGTVYITNRRLLFDGALKNAAIKLDKIINISPYTDGVGIEKDAGKSPILGFTDDIEMFCAVLARAVNDYR